VPYTLVDEEIPDHWTCSDNLWDAAHRSCNVPQELPDNEIDEILLAQARLPLPLSVPLLAAGGGGSTQVANSLRGEF